MSINGRIISFIVFLMVFGLTLTMTKAIPPLHEDGGAAHSVTAPHMREMAMDTFASAAAASPSAPLLHRPVGNWSGANIDSILDDSRMREALDELERGRQQKKEEERPADVAEWAVELREILTEPSLTPIVAESQDNKGKWADFRWGLGKPTYANFDTQAVFNWLDARDVEINRLCVKAESLIAIDRASRVNIREAFKYYSGPVIAVTELGGVFFNFASRESRDSVVIPVVTLSALLGLVATQADVPLAVVSLGETFNLAISGPASSTIMALVTSLSLLPYTHQNAKFLLTSVRRWYKEPLNQMRRKESGIQGVAKAMVVLSSLVRAGVKLAYLLALEADSSVPGGRIFAGIVAGPSVFSEWLWQMKVGRTALDNSYHHNMQDALTDNKRRILKKGIENCLLRASQDPVFCDKVFNVVQSNFRSSFHFEQWILENIPVESTKMSDKEVALSALFLIYGSHRTRDTAFGCDFRTISSDLRGGTFSRYLVDASSGIATAVSFIGTSYGVGNLIFKNLVHLAPSVAVTSASKAIGGAVALATGLLRFRSPVDEQYNIKAIPPVYKSYPVWRGLGRVASSLNSALQMWWPVSIANQAFGAASAPSDIVIPVLVCYAAHEYASCDRRYNEGIQDTITHVGLRTINWRNPSSSAKLNLVTYVGGKLGKEISRFPDETVRNLYEVIFASHLDRENMSTTSAIIHSSDLPNSPTAAAAAAVSTAAPRGTSVAKDKERMGGR